MATFQPAPTWAPVIVVNQTTGSAEFNPIWLNWFLNLVQVLSESGAGGGGGIQHNSLTGLQGGSASQYYHLTSAQATSLASLLAGTAAITGTTILASTELRIADTKLLRSTVALANGAAGFVGTLNNAPVAGDPTKWASLNDNGTVRFIPLW